MKDYQKLDQDELNEEFITACYQGYVHKVRYLLTSPDLLDHAELNAKDNFGFRIACEAGKLNVIKYLLNARKLAVHANIHAAKDDGFISACDQGHLEVVEYFIFERNIQLSEDIVEYLIKPNNKGLDNGLVLNLFQSRELNNTLQNNLKYKLSMKNTAAKKLKL